MSSRDMSPAHGEPATPGAVDIRTELAHPLQETLHVQLPADEEAFHTPDRSPPHDRQELLSAGSSVRANGSEGMGRRTLSEVQKALQQRRGEQVENPLDQPQMQQPQAHPQAQDQHLLPPWQGYPPRHGGQHDPHGHHHEHDHHHEHNHHHEHGYQHGDRHGGFDFCHKHSGNSSAMSFSSLREYDSDEETGEDYSSRMQMIALEALAPRTTPHIWVVKQGLDGRVEVYTPPDLGDFVNLATPYLLRDPHRRRRGRAQHTELPHFWVDFQGLGEAELRQLGQLLVLHELTVEDMIAEDCPEKLEVFDDLEYHFAMLGGFWPDQSASLGYKDSKVSCILLYNWCITIHRGPFVGLDELLKRVRKDFVMSERRRQVLLANARLNDPSLPQLRKMKSLWLLYCLFDILVDSMIPMVAQIWDSANQVDELILELWGQKEPEMNDTTRHMARTRNQIGDMRRSVVAKEVIIKENRLYQQPQYRDVLDHVKQMLDRIDSARDVVAQANSNYLAGVSVQAAIGANSTNEVMKRLSFLAFAISPMTLVTSMFGMNVRVPFQAEDGEKSTFAFWIILLCMLGPVLLGFLIYFLCTSRRAQREMTELDLL